MKRYGLSLLILMGAGGCGEFDAPFVCATDDQCVKSHAVGTCEPTGSCSFPDTSCPSRRRYAELAPEEMVNRCVTAPDQLALGDQQSCAVLVGGALRCWGNTPDTLDGAVHILGPTSDNMVLFNLPSVSDVDLAEEHGCAVADDAVWCWGNNQNARLGVDDTSATGPHPVPSAIASGTAKGVTTGRRHSCALGPEGVRCWGDNSEGQLGRSMPGDALSPASVASEALDDVVELDAGDSHTCAQPAWGLLSCWGSNELGQVGAPLEVPIVNEPHELPFYALEFSLGGSHSCAINTSGEVLCWGDNTLGQLGRKPEPGGDRESQGSPTPLRVATDGVTDWMKATHIASGWAHSCAILVDGSVACWGDNREGQLGPEAESVPGVSTPVPVALPERALEISAGRDHSCARTQDGLIWCWGGNARGQLGNGSVMASASPDAQVSSSLATP